MRRLRLVQFVRRQHRQRIKINAKPNAHADAGGGEAVVPAGRFTDRATNERRQERTDVDADVEDGVGAVAAAVVGRIKSPDLGRDIRLESAAPENERKQREQEKLLDRHHEMADCHQDRAKHDGAALAEHLVGKQPAENRG